MIAVNLLPVREWKKRESVRQQISIYILSLILLMVSMVAVGLAVQGKVSSLRKELQQLENRRKNLEYVNVKIREFKKRAKEIEEKFRAVEKLQQGRTRTVKILDEVVSSIPINRMWLTNLNLKQNNLTLSGIALDNHTVALFMRRLEASRLVQKVKLKNTSRKNIQGHELMQFDLNIDLKS